MHARYMNAATCAHIISWAITAKLAINTVVGVVNVFPASFVRISAFPALIQGRRGFVAIVLIA